MNAQEKERRRAAMDLELERRQREEEERQREEAELQAWLPGEPPSGTDAHRQSMRDAAFELLQTHGSGYPGPALSRRRLAQLFPEVSGDEYSSIYFELLDESEKMRDAAREVAADLWYERVSKLGALRQLAERFPGFSLYNYESALSYWSSAFR